MDNVTHATRGGGAANPPADRQLDPEPSPSVLFLSTRRLQRAAATDAHAIERHSIIA
jgi:hypothetical protein